MWNYVGNDENLDVFSLFDDFSWINRVKLFREIVSSIAKIISCPHTEKQEEYLIVLLILVFACCYLSRHLTSANSKSRDI